MIKFKENELYLKNTALKLDYFIDSILVYKGYVFVLYQSPANNKEHGTIKNLEAFTEDGKKLWTADSPKWAQEFSYCDLEIKRRYFIGKNYLFAYSTGSYICKIDIETGKIFEEIFTK